MPPRLPKRASGNAGHTQPKVVVSHATFLNWCITPIDTDDKEFCNLTAKCISAFSLWSRVFPGVELAQEHKNAMSFILGHFQQNVMRKFSEN